MAVLSKNGTELARWETIEADSTGRIDTKIIRSARSNGFILVRVIHRFNTPEKWSTGWRRKVSIRDTKTKKLVRGERLWDAIGRRLWLHRTTAEFFSEKSRIKGFVLKYAVPEVIQSIRNFDRGALGQYKWNLDDEYTQKGWKK